ncbi:unnamed protein product, partial [Didymodactylos carnosus]
LSQEYRDIYDKCPNKIKTQIDQNRHLKKLNSSQSFQSSSKSTSVILSGLAQTSVNNTTPLTNHNSQVKPVMSHMTPVKLSEQFSTTAPISSPSILNTPSTSISIHPLSGNNLLKKPDDHNYSRIPSLMDGLTNIAQSQQSPTINNRSFPSTPQQHQMFITPPFKYPPTPCSSIRFHGFQSGIMNKSHHDERYTHNGMIRSQYSNMSTPSFSNIQSQNSLFQSTVNGNNYGRTLNSNVYESLIKDNCENNKRLLPFNIQNTENNSKRFRHIEQQRQD